jgi:hypothetical protein
MRGYVILVEQCIGSIAKGSGGIVVVVIIVDVDVVVVQHSIWILFSALCINSYKYNQRIHK